MKKKSWHNICNVLVCVRVEVNELKHAEMLKWSCKNTLWKHFTCKNVHVHDMHTCIYIVCCSSESRWALKNCVAHLLALTAKHNDKSKGVCLSVRLETARNSLFFLSHHWWTMGSTGLGRCMSGENPAGLWTGIGRFSPGLSYVRQAERAQRGAQKERKTYEACLSTIYFFSNEKNYRNEQWRLTMWDGNQMKDKLSENLQSSKCQSSAAGSWCCHSLASLWSPCPTPWIYGCIWGNLHMGTSAGLHSWRWFCWCHSCLSLEIKEYSLALGDLNYPQTTTLLNCSWHKFKIEALESTSLTCNRWQWAQWRGWGAELPLLVPLQLQLICKLQHQNNSLLTFTNFTQFDWNGIYLYVL